MKGTTRISRIQNKQEQNKPYTSNYSLVDKQKESNTPFKITIKTTYERGYNNDTNKSGDKPESDNKKHFHKLTVEERKKFSRGLRPSAAQREADELAKMSQKQREGMIEIIDKTNYSNEQNNNIKLKPNKKVLINRKREINPDERKKFSRGLRPKEAEKEKEEIIVKERQYGQKKAELINTNQINNRRNGNNQQNKEIQLLPNKKTVIKNPRTQSSIPIPKNNESRRNLTSKVQKPIINEPKSGLRNNTVSHAIIEKRKEERKPYVLNERKTETIKFTPRALQKYNDVILGDKDEPYKGSNNHSIIITKNITKDNYSRDPNLKNTSSHKIDATKKEQKKEIIVQPRQLTVIKSVIPSSFRHMTEVNDNTNKNYNQYSYSKRPQTDKKPQKDLAQKIATVKEYKIDRQRYQPKNDDKNIRNNEPQKLTNTYASKYTKPTIISKPDQKQIPPSQYTRIKPDFSKQKENKYQPQPNTYNSAYTKIKTQIQTQPPKQTQIASTRTQIQTNKYIPSNIKESNKIQTKSNINTQPSNMVNKIKGKNLDNNDVKQIVYKNERNSSNEKPKNYVVSNAEFARNRENNEFVISKANEAKNSTTINYNINNENKPIKDIINKEIKIEKEPIIIEKEIINEPKEEIKIEKEEKVEEIKVEKEEEEEKIPNKEENEEQKEEPIKEQEQIERKEEKQLVNQVEEQNVNIENNEQEPEKEKENIEENNQELENKKLDINIEDNPKEIKEEQIKIEESEEIKIPTEQNIEEKKEQIILNEQEKDIQEPQDQEVIEQNQNINMQQENEEGDQYEEEMGEGEEQIENGEGYENYEEMNGEGYEGEKYDEDIDQYGNMNEEMNYEEEPEEGDVEEEVGEEEIQDIEGGEEEDEAEGENEIDEGNEEQ